VQGSAVQRIAVAAAVGLLPGFITMLRTRMFVYEEAVVYGYLWAVLQLALVAGAASTRKAGWSYAAAAAAGFGALIRPTLFLYGAATMLALLLVHRRSKIGAAASAIFCAMTLVVLWTNVARFGDPLEFGQRVNVSRWVLDQFAKNFDYPYAHEPLAAAARELGAALTSNTIRFNGNGFYLPGPSMHPSFSPTVRFREFYFTTGLAPFIALAVAAWLLVAARSIRDRFHALDTASTIVAVWALLSFIAMAAFYLRMPTLTSRYVMDFAAAIAAGVAALMMWLFDRDDFRQRFRIAAVVALVALIASGVRGGVISPTHAAQPLATEAIVGTLPEPVMTGPAVPSSYQCGDRLDDIGIPFNGVGWQWNGDCSLDAGSTLFMTLPADRSCVEIRLEPEPDRRDIEVKFAATRLVRNGSLYCLPPRFTRNPLGIEIVSLKWVAAAELTILSRPPFKMRSIQVR
jgi:hypothetical protein